MPELTLLHQILLKPGDHYHGAMRWILVDPAGNVVDHFGIKAAAQYDQAEPTQPTLNPAYRERLRLEANESAEMPRWGMLV